jgi:hypothetical protein
MRSAAAIRTESPLLSSVELFRQAQQVLPEDRRRRDKALYPCMMPQAQLDKLDLYAEQYVAVRSNEDKVEEDEIARLRAENAQLMARISELEGPAAMMRALKQCLSEAIRPVVETVLREIVTPPAAGPRATVTLVQRPSRPTVLVVGLLGSQAEAIKRDFSERLELRFLSQDDSQERMRQHCASAHVVYGMVGYMDHNTDAVLRKAAGDRYTRVNGTVGELTRLLTARSALSAA